MIYYTEDQEIISLYNTYNELKKFINYYNESKTKFINFYKIKTSTSYYAFPNDKFGYSNEQKVNKEFLKGLDIKRVEKFSKLYAEYNNKYVCGLDGNLYIRVSKLHEKDISNEVLKDCINLLRSLEKLKAIMKKLIKCKINGEVLNDTNYYWNQVMVIEPV